MTFKKYSTLSFRSFAAAIIAATAMFGASYCVDAATSADVSASDESAVRTVRVGYFCFDGFLSRDARGNRSGYGYDYFQELRNYRNWNYVYDDSAATWAEMQSKLREGSIDIIIGMRKTPEREAHFDFSDRPVIDSYTVLTVKAGNNDYRCGDFSNWNGIKIGFPFGTPLMNDVESYAKQNGFSFNPIFFKTRAELLDALQSGKVDALATSSLRNIGQNEWVYARFGHTSVYAAVRKSDKALLAELNETMREVDSLLPDLREALRREYYVHESSDILSLSASEREFVQNAKRRGKKFACFLNPDRKPFSWIENGKFYGILKDYADEISLRTGLDFDFIPIKTRKEYYEKRLSRESEIVLDTIMRKSDAERAGFRLSQPYFSGSISVLRNKNADNTIKTVSILVPDEISALAILPKKVAVRSCESPLALLNDLETERSDAAFLLTRTAEYAVYSGKYGDLVSNYKQLAETMFCVAVRNSQGPLVLSIINKAIGSLDEGDVDKIRSKYQPQLGSRFSFGILFRRYPLLAVVLPMSLLLTGCIVLLYILNRRRKIYQTGVLFGNLPLRCFVVNGNGDFLYYNLGQRSTLTEVGSFRSLNDIPDEGVRNLMYEKVRDVLSNGKSANAEFDFDGSHRSAAIVKLPDSAFGTDSVLWISQDISALQASRDEIRKHEEFFRLTLESIGDGVITTDAKGNVMMLNYVAEKMMGISSAESLGKPHEEVFRIESAIDGKTVNSPLRNALETGNVVELANHTDLLSFDGKRYNIADCASSIKNRDGEIIGGILIFRDVTQEYRRRAELREMVAHWEAAADIAKLYTYRVNLDTLDAYGDLSKMKQFWPVVNGKILPASAWIKGDDASKFKLILDEFKAGKRRDFTFTYSAERNDKVRHYRLFGRFEENGSGLMTGIVQDVTEIVETLEKLKATTLMWKNVMDELPVLFFVKDVDNENRYVMCNKANAEFLGIPESDVIGKTTGEICSPSSELEEYLKSENRILADNVIDRTRMNIPDAKGFQREMEKIEMPVLGVNGRKLLVGISFDVTEREQSLRLAKLSEKLLSEIVMESDFVKVLDIAAKYSIEILDCERVIFSKIGDDGRLHFLREHGGISSNFANSKSVVLLHENIWNFYLDRLKNNETICFGHMDDFPQNIVLLKDFPQYKKASAAATPVFVDGKFVGVMVVSFASAHHFTEIEKRTLRAISDCILIAENRAKTEAQLRGVQLRQSREFADKSALNQCLNVFMKSDYMSIPFDAILEIIRKHLGASHCYVLQLDLKSNLEICIAEAVVEGSRKFIKDSPPISFDSAAQWYIELNDMEIVRWDDLTSEKSRAKLSSSWRRATEEHTIKSEWEAVLKPEGNTWGTLGILYGENAERGISAEDESFVRSAAQLVSLILMRSMSRDSLIKAKNDLTSALQKAKAAEKAKSYFLASMSHEIRTPLNAVIGFTELMKDSAMDRESQQECLENIYSSGNALLQLINDILDLSKLEAGQMQIINERTDFPLFCKEVCRPFQYSSTQKMLNLLVEVPEAMPMLMLDQLRIRQILFNLVGNAVKFTKEGMVRIKAKFTQFSTSHGSLLLQVTDTGIGILKADQKKLFEPFVQLSKMRGTNASNSGTGLGLVIVRKLVDKMGGTMTLESEEGKGSTFSILLPRVEIVDDGESSEKCNAEKSDSKILKVENISRFNSTPEHIDVLIVDDIPMNTKILSTMLKRIKVNSVSVNSGKLVLEKLAEKHFDWVITDLLMKDMNGVELAIEIRKNPAYNDIRLAAVTAEQDALSFDKKLFAVVLTKPVGIAQLQNCLFGK